ncbi:MAG: hypothetical protein V1851_00665 [Patescibacteria group bacterium]
MKKTEIIPAVLPKTFEELREKLNKIKKAYDVLEIEHRVVQIDVCEATLNKSFDLFRKEIEELRDKTIDFEIELDFITKDFKTSIDEWIDLGVQRVIIHYANLKPWNIFPWIFKFNKFVKKNSDKIEIGLGINLETPLNKILPYLKKVKFVQFMGIKNIGHQGQIFDVVVLEKIKELRKINSEIIVSVDGGINLDNAQSVIMAGANRLVIGSAILNENSSVEEIVRNIKSFNNF